MPKLNDARVKFLVACRDGLDPSPGEGERPPPCTLGANGCPEVVYCRRAGWVRGERGRYIDSMMPHKRGYPWNWFLTDAGREALSAYVNG